MSPSSEAFSTQPASKEIQPHAQKSTANGNSMSPSAERPKTPKNAFELFANENRSVLAVKHRHDIKDGKYDLDQELARKWRSLPEDQQREFEARYQSKDFTTKSTNNDEDGDEDVEMADDADGDNDDD